MLKMTKAATRRHLDEPAWVYDPETDTLYTGQYHQKIIVGNDLKAKITRHGGHNEWDLHHWESPLVFGWAIVQLDRSMKVHVMSDYVVSTATPEELERGEEKASEFYADGPMNFVSAMPKSASVEVVSYLTVRDEPEQDNFIFTYAPETDTLVIGNRDWTHTRYWQHGADIVAGGVNSTAGLWFHDEWSENPEQYRERIEDLIAEWHDSLTQEYVDTRTAALTVRGDDSLQPFVDWLGTQLDLPNTVTVDIVKTLPPVGGSETFGLHVLYDPVSGETVPYHHVMVVGDDDVHTSIAHELIHVEQFKKAVVNRTPAKAEADGVLWAWFDLWDEDSGIMDYDHPLELETEQRAHSLVQQWFSNQGVRDTPSTTARTGQRIRPTLTATVLQDSALAQLDGQVQPTSYLTSAVYSASDNTDTTHDLLTSEWSPIPVGTAHPHQGAAPRVPPYHTGEAIFPTESYSGFSDILLVQPGAKPVEFTYTAGNSPNIPTEPLQATYVDGKGFGLLSQERVPFVYHIPTNSLYYSDPGAYHKPILRYLEYLNYDHGGELARNEDDYESGVFWWGETMKKPDITLSYSEEDRNELESRLYEWMNANIATLWPERASGTQRFSDARSEDSVDWGNWSSPNIPDDLNIPPTTNYVPETDTPAHEPLVTEARGWRVVVLDTSHIPGPAPWENNRRPVWYSSHLREIYIGSPGHHHRPLMKAMQEQGYEYRLMEDYDIIYPDGQIRLDLRMLPGAQAAVNAALGTDYPPYESASEEANRRQYEEGVSKDSSLTSTLSENEPPKLPWTLAAFNFALDPSKSIMEEANRRAFVFLDGQIYAGFAHTSILRELKELGLIRKDAMLDLGWMRGGPEENTWFAHAISYDNSSFVNSNPKYRAEMLQAARMLWEEQTGYPTIPDPKWEKTAGLPDGFLRWSLMEDGTVISGRFQTHEDLREHENIPWSIMELARGEWYSWSADGIVMAAIFDESKALGIDLSPESVVSYLKLALPPFSEFQWRKRVGGGFESGTIYVDQKTAAVEDWTVHFIDNSKQPYDLDLWENGRHPIWWLRDERVIFMGTKPGSHHIPLLRAMKDVGFDYTEQPEDRKRLNYAVFEPDRPGNPTVTHMSDVPEAVEAILKAWKDYKLPVRPRGVNPDQMELFTKRRAKVELEQLSEGDTFLNWEGKSYTFEPLFEGESRQGLAAYDGADLVGSITWSVEGDFIFLRSAYVDPGYRGEGIFRQMWDAMTAQHPELPVEYNSWPNSTLAPFVDGYNKRFATGLGDIGSDFFCWVYCGACKKLWIDGYSYHGDLYRKHPEIRDDHAEIGHPLIWGQVALYDDPPIRMYSDWYEGWLFDDYDDDGNDDELFVNAQQEDYFKEAEPFVEAWLDKERIGWRKSKVVAPGHKLTSVIEVTTQGVEYEDWIDSDIGKIRRPMFYQPKDGNVYVGDYEGVHGQIARAQDWNYEWFMAAVRGMIYDGDINWQSEHLVPEEVKAEVERWFTQNVARNKLAAEEDITAILVPTPNPVTDSMHTSQAIFYNWFENIAFISNVPAMHADLMRGLRLLYEAGDLTASQISGGMEKAWVTTPYEASWTEENPDTPWKPDLVGRITFSGEANLSQEHKEAIAQAVDKYILEPKMSAVRVDADLSFDPFEGRPNAKGLYGEDFGLDPRGTFVYVDGVLFWGDRIHPRMLSQIMQEHFFIPNPTVEDVKRFLSEHETAFGRVMWEGQFLWYMGGDPQFMDETTVSFNSRDFGESSPETIKKALMEIRKVRPDAKYEPKDW
jgi:hypothetical protein